MALIWNFLGTIFQLEKKKMSPNRASSFEGGSFTITIAYCATTIITNITHCYHY